MSTPARTGTDERVPDILPRLESFNEFSETSDARQLRKDAAEEIRATRARVSSLETTIAQLRQMRAI